MKLIGSIPSPFARKVRVVLAEKKLDYQFELKNVWDDDSISESNPLGQVPCLVLDDGQVLFDSHVIVDFLDSCSPGNRLIPSSNRERIEVLTWEALADGLLDAAILVRLELSWAGRTPEQRCQAWIDRQMGKIHLSLQALSKNLADKPWCMAGNRMTLADIAVACALLWLDFRFPDLNWRTSHPNLASLTDKLSERPSFLNTLPQVS
jgi:glutathione S-transferase